MTTATTARTPLIMRNDTLLGVCEGLGEDFGISGNWFRIAFALALFVSPVAAIAGYLVAGAVVLASRLIVRAPRKKADVVTIDAEPAVKTVDDAEALPLAA